MTDMMYMGKEGRTKIILKLWLQVIDNMGPLISEVPSGGGSKLSGGRQSWGDQFCAFEFDLLHSSRWWCSVVRSEQSWEVRLWDTEAKGAQRSATELKLLGFRHWMGLSVFYSGICKLSFNYLFLTKYTFLFLLKSRIECTWIIAWKKQMPNIICLHFLPSIFSSKNEGVISVNALLIFARKPFGGSLVTWI